MINLTDAESFIQEQEEKKLEESSTLIPKDPKQALASKIESLMRSIENLSQKKIRIEFEITRQKRSLARKREELKRVSKSLNRKVSIRLESTDNPGQEKDLEGQQKVFQRLLSESARILED